MTGPKERGKVEDQDTGVQEQSKPKVFQRKYRVTGRVQDVWFRSFCSNIAYPLHISGYAKNEHDGSVTVLVQGDPGLLDSFLETLKEIAAKDDEIVIRDIELVSEGETTDSFEDFSQLYPDQDPHETIEEFRDRVYPPDIFERLRRRLRSH